jgi:hypothetical protein
MSQASSLDAISMSVDEGLDRQVKTDVQEIFADPSLLTWDAGRPDASAEDSSSPPENDPVRSRRLIPAATSWSSLQPVTPPAEAELALPAVPDHAAAVPLLPVLGAAPETGDSSRLNSIASPQPNAGLLRLQAQKQDRDKRQARELQNKSERQCA